MPTTNAGLYLNKYVAPQLLRDLKDYNEGFMSILRTAPQAAVTADGIRWNKLINNIGFYVNNTANFTPKKMTGENVIVGWEKYDTDPTEVDDAEIRYLQFDKRSEVRAMHVSKCCEGLTKHSLHKLAPDNNTSEKMPVMVTTGKTFNGRKRLTFEDLANYLEKVKNIGELDASQFYLMLCPPHVTDLLLDRDAAAYIANKDVFFDPVSGKVRSFMGFKFYEPMVANAYTSALVKKPKNSAMATGDQFASTFVYAPNTVRHLEKLKILYKTEYEDTRNADPKSEIRIQVYGIIDRIEDFGMGAIVSANA